MLDLILKITLLLAAISVVTGTLGSFLVVQRKALQGDVLAHAILPGIILGYLLVGLQHYPLLFVAACFGYLALIVMKKLKASTPFSIDTIQAITISGFLSLGLVGLSFLQLSPDTAQSGLDQFLYGSVVSMSWKDTWIALIIAAIVSVTIILSWKNLVAWSFQEQFFTMKVKNAFLIRTIFNLLVLTAVVFAVQAVGVILTSSLLITPFAIAKTFSSRLKQLILLAVCCSIALSILSTCLSALVWNTPTGPTHVVLLTLVFAIILSVQLFKTRKHVS